VASRRQNGAKPGTEQAARAADDEPATAVERTSVVERQVTRCDTVPEVERSLKFIGYGPARQQRRCWFEGKSVLDPVLEQGCVRIDRLEAMRVLPASKRALELDVREAATRNTVAMFGYPPHRHWTEADLKYGPGAIPDSSRVLQKLDRLPRRRQSLQGARAGMPVVHQLRGKSETARLVKHMECHGVLLPADRDLSTYELPFYHLIHYTALAIRAADRGGNRNR
jgi:hypothetical protein